MSTDQNDLRARLIYDALSQLDTNVDAQHLIERINRLELGLPVEDECIFLLSWLGKCRLIHKLDQLAFPPTAPPEYRVPDLFAVFERDGKQVPVLIEVKGKQSMAFSWRPDYVEGLRRYGKLLGLPVLIACKWKMLGYWTLIDLEQYEQPNRNCKYTFANALRQNLLGILAGDFMFKMMKGVGLHVVARKEVKLGEKREGDIFTEEYKVKIEGGYFTNGLGECVDMKDDVLWALFLSTDLTTESEVTDTHIIHSLVVPPDESLQPAHRALAILLSHFVDENNPLNWRKALLDHHVLVESSVLRKAASDGIKQNYVRYVFNQIPETMPTFL